MKEFQSARSLDQTRLAEVRAQLKKRNAEFRGLADADKRVAIAKDVIAQVRARKIVADSVYLEWSRKLDNFKLATSLGEQIGECTSQMSCQACGIGSMFIAAVEFHDRLDTEQFRINGSGSRAQLTEYLNKWFESEQLDLIELYFERSLAGKLHEELMGHNRHSPITKQRTDNTRLVMIMQNIISNKGKFNPLAGRHSVPKKFRHLGAMK